MSTTLEFYAVPASAYNAPVVLNIEEDFKQFTNELIFRLQHGESGSLVAHNASECITFHISNLSFRRALYLAGYIDKTIDQQIKELINEHLKWARARLYRGLCCYINDEMYPVLEQDPTYTRDLAAVFRMAVFNKAITENIHETLTQFVAAQPIETVMLAISNFEQECETIALMRKVHQLACQTLINDSYKWYQTSITHWKSEPVRQIEYTYAHYMWLDTQVIVQPPTGQISNVYRKIPVVYLDKMQNAQMADALLHFAFVKVEILECKVTLLPTFDKIKIDNQIFCRQSSKQPIAPVISPVIYDKDIQKYDDLLAQIVAARIRLNAPIKTNIFNLK